MEHIRKHKRNKRDTRDGSKATIPHRSVRATLSKSPGAVGRRPAASHWNPSVRAQSTKCGCEAHEAHDLLACRDTCGSSPHPHGYLARPPCAHGAPQMPPSSSPELQQLHGVCGCARVRRLLWPIARARPEEMLRGARGWRRPTQAVRNAASRREAGCASPCEPRQPAGEPSRGSCMVRGRTLNWPIASARPIRVPPTPGSTSV